MLFIPFPLVIAEIIIFILSVDHFGFLRTLGYYFLPSILGFFIVSIVGRMALVSLQSTVMRGQVPPSKILSSAAVFLSGFLFLIPSFFSRVLGLVLLLPGLRHIAIWRFKKFMAKKMASGASGFNFSSGPFGFSGGVYGFQNAPPERDVAEANIVDVKPLEVTHEKKATD